MKNDESDLSNIFLPFYDREEEYLELIKRLQHEQAPDDETYAPFVSFDGLSPEEQQIVDSHFLHEKRALAATLTQSTAYPEESAPFFQPALAPLQLSLLHTALRKGGNKPNAFLLLQKIIFQCCLRNFEGRIYCMTENSVYAELSDADLKSLVFQILEPEIALDGSPRLLRQVVELLTSYPGIRINRTTDDVNHLYFLNGCLDAVTGQFRPIGPDDFFTSYLDFEYPTGYVPACPCFDTYLQTVSGGDPKIVELILEMLGYLIVPDMSAKCFFLLYGVSDSGKSVLGDLISKLFNKSAVSSVDIYRLKDRFSASGLEGCRVNVSMDLPNARISNEAVGMLKMLTGGDEVTVEQKFKDAKSRRLNCKLVFGSNHPLLLSSTDDAFCNRLVTVPFLYAIPKEQQDPHLREKLLQERPGIAVKAIAAYWRLRGRNYQFPVYGSKAVTGVCGYTPFADILQQFIAEQCEFVKDAFTPTNILMASFNAYSELCGMPQMADTAQFSRSLNQHCAGRIQNKKRRIGGVPTNGYLGIQLK